MARAMAMAMAIFFFFFLPEQGVRRHRDVEEQAGDVNALREELGDAMPEVILHNEPFSMAKALIEPGSRMGCWLMWE